jgi:hypothetical protein
MAGDTAKAKAAYNDFLTLWKDADPDIPIPKQAKAEYTNLQSQPWPVLSIEANRRLIAQNPVVIPADHKADRSWRCQVRGEPKKEKLSCPKVNRPCVPQSFACCLRTPEVCLRIDLATLRSDYLGIVVSHFLQEGHKNIATAFAPRTIRDAISNSDRVKVCMIVVWV